MFTNSEKKILKEASKNGPFIIKGFNYHGIPFIISGELADSKNSNCRAPITDTSISIAIKISDNITDLGFDQRLTHFLHESKNIYIELTNAIDPSKQLDGSHLYIDCITNSDGQIIYLNSKSQTAIKNIDDILIADDGTSFDNENEIDDVTKMLFSYIGKPVCLENPSEKHKLIGVPISITMLRNVARSKIILARDNTISFFQITPDTKLYDLSKNNTKLIAENDPEKISLMQKILTERLMKKKPTTNKAAANNIENVSTQKQPGSEE